LTNVKCIKGSWKEKDLSDSDLKNLYTSSKVSIIPLHNSTQPSGQSVALQSMSLGIPVLISNTEGFWDKDLFEHEKDLVFVDPSDLRNWVLQIESIINDESKQGKIVANAKNKVLSNYNLHQFHKNLLKYF
jgi:glycosyltransferase involved in cell wall biosynthesis